MKCNNCGHEMPDNSKFCPSCGKAVVDAQAAPALKADAQEKETQVPAKQEPNKKGGILKIIGGVVGALVLLSVIGSCMSGNKDSKGNSTTLERTYVYHLLSGEFGLTRDKLVQFAIAGGFNLEETNTLLKYGHMAPLYARDTRDAVLIYSLNRKLSLMDTNQALEELGHKLLK